jgi:hypothetical protein
MISNGPFKNKKVYLKYLLKSTSSCSQRKHELYFMRIGVYKYLLSKQWNFLKGNNKKIKTKLFLEKYF